MKDPIRDFIQQAIAPEIFHSGHTPKLSGRTGGVLEKTVLRVVDFLKATVENDALASRTGFLQRTDPRIKCLSVALLLGCALLTKSIVELALLYAACVTLAVFSSISLLFFLERTLLFIPLFSFFIVIPAIFNVITPGESVLSFKAFGAGLTITRQGIDSALIFFMRVLASVSLTILVMLTTRHHVLLRTLRIFKVPRLFVMTMSMCYRYIFLLLDVLHNTFIAIKSRVGYVTSAKTGGRLVAVNMAGMWLRSYQLYGQVYDAMVSRGYTGEPIVLDNFKPHAGDYLLLAASFFTLIGTLWLNRFFR